jgi:hypothetical protein
MTGQSGGKAHVRLRVSLRIQPDPDAAGEGSLSENGTIRIKNDMAPA